MGNVNKVFLLGRIGSDIELKTTPNGKSVVNVSLATSEFFKDQSGNRQEKTEWHRLQMWERIAEIASQYCHKGSQIFVEGSLQTREWQDKDGNKRYTTEIVIRNLQLLDSKQSDGQQGNQYNSGSQPQSNYPIQKSQQEDDILEDNIPF